MVVLLLRAAVMAALWSTSVGCTTAGDPSGEAAHGGERATVA